MSERKYLTDEGAPRIPVALLRLLRRIRWLLIYQWRSLTLKQWPYESCWMCGKSFRVRWSVEDKYWRDVVGVPDAGGGSLCVDCFVEYAKYLGIRVPFGEIKIEVFEPESEEG